VYFNDVVRETTHIGKHFIHPTQIVYLLLAKSASFSPSSDLFFTVDLLQTQSLDVNDNIWINVLIKFFNFLNFQIFIFEKLLYDFT